MELAFEQARHRGTAVSPMTRHKSPRGEPPAFVIY